MSFPQSVKKFFGSSSNATQQQGASGSPEESVHINQEMYKKSLELAERNKTLALLENLNELILGSITNLNEISKEVTSLLVNEVDFTIVSIFFYDKQKNVLQSLALSQINKVNNSPITSTPQTEIALANEDNLIVQATKKKTALFTDSTKNVYIGHIESEEDIKSVFIAPLIVRGELIGALTIGMSEKQSDLSEYRMDLLNRLVGVIGIGLDNAVLYNQVQTTNDKLQNANQKLQELDKLKNEFVSVASHELRTPMTAIKSYLWMALNGKGGQLNEKQHYYVERGYNSVDRLIRLVNDMLNISRIESGRITITLQSVDLIALSQEVVDEVLPRANEVGVSVTLQKVDSLPHVLADPDKIKEVLFNLIGNSLKFTPKDGTIILSYAEKDGFIETKITDTGSGIAPEDLGKLFQKFGLLPGSYITNQTSVSNGTGLGLFICKAIIGLHHGEIKAASEGRGKGSTFSFTLKKFEASDLQTSDQDVADEEKEAVGLIHATL